MYTCAWTHTDTYLYLLRFYCDCIESACLFWENWHLYDIQSTNTLLIFNEYSSRLLSPCMVLYTHTHTILHKLGHVTHVDFIKSTIFYIFFNLFVSLYTHTSPPPFISHVLWYQPVLNLSTHIVYAHMAIYIHKYMYVLWKSHNYKSRSYKTPFSACAFLIQNYMMVTPQIQ